MFPSDLLVVRKKKGDIVPRFARPSTDNLKVATNLIEAYKKHVGNKKKHLKATVAELENREFDYRFIRGLSALLDRRSTFTSNSKVNPINLRRNIFQATEKFGVPTTTEKRQRIIAYAASKMALQIEDIEAYLYADLDEELIFEKFNSVSASGLLEQYNLSLTQTLLFDATELSFTATGNWQRLFYSMKKLGLIYEVHKKDSYWVTINGPASLFKLTRRYGISLAKLLPSIITNSEWALNAKILWRYTNEIYNLKMDNQKHGSLLRKPNVSSVVYDSSVEENFASRFQAVKSGWTLRREPEPIPTGNQVMIPDFSLERAGTKVYLEVMGFWTEEYLLRKIKKLKQVDAKMLLLVNETLACEKLAALEKRPQLSLIYYHNKIPLAPILRYLKNTFEEIKDKETKFLKNLSVKFTEPIVVYDEFASRIGITAESVNAVLAVSPPTGYIALSHILVSKEKLAQIDTKIEQHLKQMGKSTLTDVTSVIEKEGVSDASGVLAALGYKITWHGINSKQAEVSKRSK